MNSIYYTSDLKPIAVTLIERRFDDAIVETRSGKQCRVPAHRIIPIKPPNQVERRLQPRVKPCGYLSAAEYLDAKNLSLGEISTKRLAQSAAWAARQLGLEGWIGKLDVRYYPEEAIARAYQKLIDKNR